MRCRMEIEESREVTLRWQRLRKKSWVRCRVRFETGEDFLRLQKKHHIFRRATGNSVNTAKTVGGEGAMKAGKKSQSQATLQS